MVGLLLILLRLLPLMLCVCDRSYNLGDPSQRNEFVEDFRLCAASNILKVTD